MFDPSTFDLGGYLERIGYGGPVAPSLETLAAIAERHPSAIPFENLDAYLRRPVALDAASLQRKLVRGGRGGWCYEHNLLLGAALSAIGFRPIGLGARVLWNMPAGVVNARSHMVLLLEISGHRFIADAGFGGLTLTAPLRLEAHVEQETPHERFRLRPVSADSDDADFVLEAEVAGQWRPLYRFDLQPQRMADYDVSNWYLCNHPGSHFLSAVIAARTAAGTRHALRGCELTAHYHGRPSERRVLASGRELREALQTTFGIDVPEGPDVDAALDRLPAPVVSG